MTLFINVLPISIDDSSVPIWSHSRDSALEDELSRRKDQVPPFQLYRWRSRTYIWPLTDSGLPIDLSLDGWDRLTASSLPARVVAFAVRDGAVRHLVALGFELISGRPEAPARLYRRMVNLAKKAFTGIKAEIGMFPLVAIQDLVLTENDDLPGKVGLIVDVRLINRLDLPLPQLAGIGMSVVGMRARWKHVAMCTCGPEPPRGTAGKVIGENLPDTVEVSTATGTVTAHAECLIPIANRWMISDYIRRVAKTRDDDIERKLQAAISRFRSNDEQWKNLTQFGKSALGAFSVFGASIGRAASPMAVADGLPPNGDSVGPHRITPAAEPKLNFRYGAPATASAPASGLRQFGPYDETTTRIDKINAIVLTPEPYEGEARRLARALETKIENFPGFEDRFHLRSFKAEIRTFLGVEASDYRAAATAAAATKPDLVFLIVRNQDRYSLELKDPYRAAKAVLVARDIPVQAVTRENLLVPDSSLQWIVSNIALAAYAKVGNVPYVLHDPSGTRELVLGIGRADIYDRTASPHQLFGAAVAFRQDGDFQFSGSTMPVADRVSYEEVLAGLISGAIDRFEESLGTGIERFTLHVFKRTGLREIRAAVRALHGRDVQFALVHVNRDSPIWLMEQKPDGRMTSPTPGTVIALRTFDRLLVTGERDEKATLHPLRVTLDRDSTFTQMDRIVDQVYGFTLTSWRTYRRTQEPSTILYGRLLAQKVGQLMPYGFDPTLAAAGLGDKPWFL